jgi:hypothetical protein
MPFAFPSESAFTFAGIPKKTRSALVTVEGTMYGGGPVKVDPKLPDWLKERFKGSSQTYGHLGSFDMMIEVEKVIDASAADDGIKPKAAHPDAAMPRKAPGN